MKLIKKDQNTWNIKTALGNIEIKDNLFNPKEGKAVIVLFKIPWDTKIEGIGTRFSVLKKKEK